MTKYVVQFVKHGSIEPQIKTFESKQLLQSWLIAYNWGEDFSWFIVGSVS